MVNLEENSSIELLLKAMRQDNKYIKGTITTLKRMLDGEPVNINPLTEIPEPEMKLYFIGNNYFLTMEELLQYCRINRLSTNDLGILEYYRNFAGRSDVIKKTSSTILNFYTAVDRDGYGLYNYERSIYRGEFTWEYNHGRIEEMYKPFRDRGIVFENDIYAKQALADKQLWEICRKRNLFNLGN